MTSTSRTKFITVVVASALMLTLAACGGQQSVTNTDNKESASSSSAPANKNTSKVKSIEEITKEVDKETQDALASMQSDFATLSGKINSYDAFVADTAELQAFYDKVIAYTTSLGVVLRERAVDYANAVLNSKKDSSEQYDDIDELFDRIYDDAGDDIYDGTYEGVLDDAYKTFYDGVIQDGYDLNDYAQWSDVSSQEYERWSDARSDVYEVWSDFRSDIYEFYSDIKGEFFDKDTERAQEKIENFQKEIESLKSQG